jgi:hypothetical protein
VSALICNLDLSQTKPTFDSTTQLPLRRVHHTACRGTDAENARERRVCIPRPFQTFPNPISQNIPNIGLLTLFRLNDTLRMYLDAASHNPTIYCRTTQGLVMRLEAAPAAVIV